MTEEVLARVRAILSDARKADALEGVRLCVSASSRAGASDAEIVSAVRSAARDRSSRARAARGG